MKLEDRIYNVEYYVKKFNSWDVKEIIIDDQKAFWEIRKPGSQIQKVCLFRDGSNMYIYGDYGSYSFDKMTWLGMRVIYRVQQSWLSKRKDVL